MQRGILRAGTLRWSHVGYALLLTGLALSSVLGLQREDPDGVDGTWMTSFFEVPIDQPIDFERTSQRWARPDFVTRLKGRAPPEHRPLVETWDSTNTWFTIRDEGEQVEFGFAIPRYRLTWGTGPRELELRSKQKDLLEWLRGELVREMCPQD